MSTASSATRANVLVVDDIIKNLQVVGTMLRNAGYAVTPATSGPEALDGVRVQAPDLILLDLMMPGMDGLEVCRRLKADPLTEQIPVIFLTAKVQGPDRRKFLELGVQGVIAKPFDPLTLGKQIIETLSWRTPETRPKSDHAQNAA